MITFLNKKQLAFILDIQAEDARAKMCVAWAKSIGAERVHAQRNIKDKIESDYPDAMPIEMLEQFLPFPGLGKAVNDIHENYLKRPATRKYILHDYPEKIIKTKGSKGEKPSINLPPGLASLISDSVRKEILQSWDKNYHVLIPSR